MPVLLTRGKRPALYELAGTTLTSHGYAEYSPGLFALDAAPRDRHDGFACHNICDFDCCIQHSGEFGQIVCGHVHIDPVTPPTSTPGERFETLKTRGASYGR